MLLNVFSLQRFFNLRSQLSKNTFIGCRIVFGTQALIHQGDINQRHQRDCMLPLATLVSLSIDIITVGYELSRSTIILLVGTINRHLDFLIVDMQLYMEFLFVYFCHGKAFTTVHRLGWRCICSPPGSVWRLEPSRLPDHRQ